MLEMESNEVFLPPAAAAFIFSISPTISPAGGGVGSGGVSSGSGLASSSARTFFSRLPFYVA